MKSAYDKFEEYASPSIDPSWSFVSSLPWLILSVTDTYLYQWRKLNPYNNINTKTNKSSK